MDISLTKGAAEGPTKLNAFDNALLEAGIGNVNLIPVSSMLPPDTHVIGMPQLKPGEMTNCVLSQVYSDTPEDMITAIIAYAQSDKMGCVVECSGVNKEVEDLEDEARFMAGYMMEKRDLEIIDYKAVIQTHTVMDKACAISALIYHDPMHH